MKVLIIGGTRFIGAHVAHRLHDAGNEVVVFHRGKSTNAILPPVEHVVDPRAAYPVTEFPQELRRDWDIVVHMVAMGRADTEAAVRVLQGLTGRLVLISSADVYRAYGRLTRSEPGPLEEVPMREDAPLRSIFYPYREMVEQLGAFAQDYEKILAEEAVRSAGTDWTIVRLPKVYGAEDNGDLASVYGYASQPDWRWTHGHVENVAAAIVLCATHAEARNEIFNVGEAVTPTMGERLERLPARPRPQSAPPPFDYRQGLVADTTKLRGLGYHDVVEERAAMVELALAGR